MTLSALIRRERGNAFAQRLARPEQTRQSQRALSCPCARSGSSSAASADVPPRRCRSLENQREHQHQMGRARVRGVARRAAAQISKAIRASVTDATRDDGLSAVRVMRGVETVFAARCDVMLSEVELLRGAVPSHGNPSAYTGDKACGICRQSVRGLTADRCCTSPIKRPPEGSKGAADSRALPDCCVRDRQSVVEGEERFGI